jgi:CRISPR-associated endonuclease Csn1
LEPGHKRAPICLLISQRFRYLQTVNNMRVLEDNGFKERELTGAEREKIINILEYKGKVTFATIRKELKLPKGTKLNLEAGDAKKQEGTHHRKNGLNIRLGPMEGFFRYTTR